MKKVLKKYQEGANFVPIQDYVFNGPEKGKCVGAGCTEIATDLFGNITGQNKYNYYPIQDSWFLRSAFKKNNDRILYDPLQGKKGSKKTLPSVTKDFLNNYNNFDLVTMERGKDHSEAISKVPNFSKQDNDDADHTGIIINTPQGKKIYHGYDGRYQLSGIEPDGTVNLNTDYAKLNYKIKSILRSNKIENYNEKVKQPKNQKDIVINPKDRIKPEKNSSNDWVNNYFKALSDSDIKQVASNFGVSPKEVMDAYAYGAGVINNETGTHGKFMMQLDQFYKRVGTDLGLKKLFKNDKSKESQGAFKMKYDDLVTDNKINQALKNLNVDVEKAGNTFKEDIDSNAIKGFLANYFVNRERLINKNKDTYNPNTQTILEGVPVDYANITQHNIPSTDMQKMVTKQPMAVWHELGEKDYTNNVLDFLKKNNVNVKLQGYLQNKRVQPGYGAPLNEHVTIKAKKRQQGGTMDMQSQFGYKDNSPFRFNPYNIINSSNITMDGVSTPLLAINNGKTYYLPPNSGEYKFKGNKTLEIPFLQIGGEMDPKQRESLNNEKQWAKNPLSLVFGMLDAITPLTPVPLSKVSATIGKVASKTGTALDNLGNKYLPNTHKFNPFSFEKNLNPNSFYRQVDEETFKEGLKSGLIKGKQAIGHSKHTGKININKAFGDDAYYNKGNLYYGMNTKQFPYLYKVNKPEEAFIPKVNGKTKKFTTENTKVRVSKEPIPINESEIFKKDWIRGYKKYLLGGTERTLEELERARKLQTDQELQNIVPINNYAATVSPQVANPVGINPIMQPTGSIKTQQLPAEVPSPNPYNTSIKLEDAIQNGPGLSREAQNAINISSTPTINNGFNTKLKNGLQQAGEIGKGLLSTIAPIQQTLLGLSRNYDQRKKIEETQRRMADQNFNPSFQGVENDYGTPQLWQEGGEFDDYDFLFGEEETDNKIAENEAKIEQSQIEQEQQDAENQALAMEIAMQDFDEIPTEEEKFVEESRKPRNNKDYGKASKVSLGNDTLKKAIDYRNYAMSLGLSKEEASGLIGNAVAESNLNPTILGTADTKGSVGLFQPHSERLVALKRYAASRGKDWRDPFVQIEQAVNELNTTHKRARGNFSTATDAARSIMNKFEIPSEAAKINSFGKRAGVAEVLMQYQQGGEYEVTPQELTELLRQGYKISL